MALVLYHRAARVCPRETSHIVAARRTAAAISLATNPSKPLRQIRPKAKNVAQLVGISCPETAAQRAKKIVEESPDPVSAIDQILKYFDSRKDFLRDPPIFRDPRRSTLVSRSRVMLRQLGSMASVTLEKLQVSFASGDFPASLRIGNELLTIAEPLTDRYRYEVAARHYLAMAHLSLGRHDRAIDQATWMIKSAKKSGDLSLRLQSFMTLGRVHLTFRHLDAAARAWERLARDVDDAVPKAWLLHEIGRCYFEMKRYKKALEMSYRSLEYADEGNSRKWLLHAKLLSGQSLLELGRLGEAVMALKKSMEIADHEGDKDTSEYISDLIDRITEALRQNVCPDESLFETDNIREEKIVEENVRRAKSDDATCRESQGLVTSRENSENIVRRLMRKSTTLKTRGKRFKSPNNLRRKNSTILRNKAKIKMIKIIKTSVSISPSKDSDSSQNGDSENEANENVDCSDEPHDDLLTSRTRVIGKISCPDDNLVEEHCDSQNFHPDEALGFDDGGTTNRTAKTYVLDEVL